MGNLGQAGDNSCPPGWYWNSLTDQCMELSPQEQSTPPKEDAPVGDVDCNDPNMVYNPFTDTCEYKPSSGSTGSTGSTGTTGTTGKKPTTGNGNSTDAPVGDDPDFWETSWEQAQKLFWKWAEKEVTEPDKPSSSTPAPKPKPKPVTPGSYPLPSTDENGIPWVWIGAGTATVLAALFVVPKLMK